MRTTGPGESALLLLDAVDVLTAEGINYAVVGAMAGSVHGIVRASFDADAVLSLSVQRAPELERKFTAAGFQTTLRRGDPDDPIGALLSLSDAFENRVDLLIGLRGLEPTAFSRAIELTFEKTALRVIVTELTLHRSMAVYRRWTDRAVPWRVATAETGLIGHLHWHACNSCVAAAGSANTCPGADRRL